MPARSTQRLNYRATLFHPVVILITLVPRLPGSNRADVPLSASRVTEIETSKPREFSYRRKITGSCHRLKRPNNAPAVPHQRPSLMHQIGRDTCLWSSFSIPPPLYWHYQQPLPASVPDQAKGPYPTSRLSFSFIQIQSGNRPIIPPEPPSPPY